MEVDVESIAPLDMENLTENWPMWKQKFQIDLFANHPDADDRRKLALFLNLVGPSGLQAINSLLPELLDFPATRLTFAEVWSAFERHCQSSAIHKETQNLHQMSQAAAQEGFLVAFNDKTLRNYYAGLSGQADKCQFECSNCRTSYKDRMVRDHLLASVPDRDILRYFMRNGNTASTEDLFQMNRELLQGTRIWHTIFPYLNLRDLHALRQTDLKMRIFINRYLEMGNNVTIDETCLSDRKFPYSEYGHLISSLTVTSVPESEIQDIFYYFPYLRKLTLKRVAVRKRAQEVDLPYEIEHFRIIDCTVDYKILMHWLGVLQYSLDTLYIEDLVYRTPNRPVAIEISGLDRIHSLTIRSDLCGTISLPSLKYLEISNPASYNIVDCHSLETLYYDSKEMTGLPTEPYITTLRSLTLRRVTDRILEHDFSKYLNLQHFKVLQHMDPRRKYEMEQKLRELPLVEIYYWDEPTEEQDLLLNLNEYCLRKIIDFLPVKDRMMLGATHSTLYRIVTTHTHPDGEFMVDLDKLPWPENRWVYEMMGRYITEIIIYNVPEAVFYPVVACFPRLKYLELLQVKLENPSLLTNFNPTQLERICIDSSPISDDFLRQLYRKANPTIRSIYHKESTRRVKDYHLELTNLRDITCVLEVESPILQLMSQNISTIECVYVLIHDGASDEDVRRMWQLITQMRRLRKLKFVGSARAVEILREDQLPQLEEVYIIEGGLEHLRPLLDRCLPRGIKKLSIGNEGPGIAHRIAARFKELNDLRIFSSRVSTFPKDSSEWMCLAQLPMLEKAYLYGLDFIPNEQVIQLVKDMPQLKELHTPMNFCLEAVPELQIYAEEQSRSFVVNGIRFSRN